MRACMLQPRGGSDGEGRFCRAGCRVDFRLPSSSGGDTSSAGPERRPKAGAIEPRSAASGARGEQDFVDTVLLGIDNLCVLWL